jgi:phosphonate metabolism protein PhnN/1,5-bisphosphokinase (PRPP-forming)
MQDETTAGGQAGCFVLVVGPSGAGKDTVIDFAHRELVRDERFDFARRTVTRAAMAEDHATMTPGEFAVAERTGAFALSWHSHGLGYGIPARVTEEALLGRIVVINASRGVIADAVRIAPRVVVAHVTAPIGVLAERLAARGRESKADIESRLAREVAVDGAGAEVVRVVNDGPPAKAGAEFLELLLRLKQGALPR